MLTFSKVADLEESDKRIKVVSRKNKELSVVGFNLKIVRKSGKYFFLSYLPTGVPKLPRKSPPGLVVLVSSVSFLIPPRAYPARCVLLVTSLLVLVNMFNAALTTTPSHPGGLTALTIWILGCIAAAFTALMFYVFILLRIRVRERKEETGELPREGRSQDYDRFLLVLHISLFVFFTMIYCATIHFL